MDETGRLGGNYIMIIHPENATVYAHLSRFIAWTRMWIAERYRRIRRAAGDRGGLSAARIFILEVRNGGTRECGKLSSIRTMKRSDLEGEEIFYCNHTYDEKSSTHTF